jgi:hypothetical protein
MDREGGEIGERRKDGDESGNITWARPEIQNNQVHGKGGAVKKVTGCMRCRTTLGAVGAVASTNRMKIGLEVSAIHGP